MLAGFFGSLSCHLQEPPGRRIARYRETISAMPPYFRSGPGKPNQRKGPVHELFAGAFRNKKFNVNRACFPKEKHQNSQKWAKFMNFSFWPFLWFGLPGRLLIIARSSQRRRNDNINKICVLEGLGERENLRKIAPKCCFFSWEIP